MLVDFPAAVHDIVVLESCLRTSSLCARIFFLCVRDGAGDHAMFGIAFFHAQLGASSGSVRGENHASGVFERQIEA